MQNVIHHVSYDQISCFGSMHVPSLSAMSMSQNGIHDGLKASSCHVGQCQGKHIFKLITGSNHYPCLFERHHISQELPNDFKLH